MLFALFQLRIAVSVVQPSDRKGSNFPVFGHNEASGTWVSAHKLSPVLGSLIHIGIPGGIAKGSF